MNRNHQLNPEVDASSENSSGAEESGEDESDEDTDQEQLLREFEKIKSERALQKQKEHEAELQKIKEQEEQFAMSSNPLMTSEFNKE